MAAILLNLVIPGAGLIVRRREWLGVAVAALFGVAVIVALAGWLLAPLAIPTSIRWVAVCLGSVTWLLAQGLLITQSRALSHRFKGKALLLKDAQVAADARDPISARAALEGALQLDPEDVDAHAQLARLLEQEGDRHAMRVAWSRVLKLDRRAAYTDEARRALAGSPET